MRLVLCDDNRIFCEALAVALEARGHRALAIATTADESIAAVARHQPDACLLDLRFQSGGDGLGAARLIRDRYPDTAVLVMSSRGDKATPLAARKIGVAGVFGKDQELDRIAAALDAIAAARPAPGPGPCPGPGPSAKPSPLPAAQPDKDSLSVLTPRETEVLRRITAGQGTRKMASEMNARPGKIRSASRLNQLISRACKPQADHKRLYLSRPLLDPCAGDSGGVGKVNAGPLYTVSVK
jgi:two-component system, NarL family, response regulator DesR